MTRIQEKTIPSAFIRLDTVVTDPDAFMNVRDMQVMRGNYNILLARRVKRTLITHNSGVVFNYASNRPATRDQGDLVYGPCPIKLTPGVRTCTLNVRAGLEPGATGSLTLYPVIDGYSESGQINDAKAIDINAVASADYTVEVDVPQKASVGNASFYLYGTSDMRGSNESSGVVLSDAGPNSFDTTTNIPVGNRVAIVGTDNSIEPRRIVVTKAITASIDRYYLDDNWNKIPDVNTDTIDIRIIERANLQSVVLYEDAVTDFSSARFSAT